jgi:gliding motility-associated-like protein
MKSFIMKLSILLGISLFAATSVFAQRAKNGDYTASTANVVVNSYTTLSANVAVNATSVAVASSTLTGGVFGAGLAPGDLVLIIQMQGATLDIDFATYTAMYPFTYAYGHINDWYTDPGQAAFGAVTSYNQAGKFEYAQVATVPDGTSMTFTCGLKNAYTASGHVQVVRVPRFANVTVNTGASIVPAVWDGATGGVVVMEIDGNLVVNAASAIDASGKGFRGGTVLTTDNSTNGSFAGSDPLQVSYIGSSDNKFGAEKGEGIGGGQIEYGLLSSRYGKGAPANGGGGGNNHNAGGGGGSNVGTGAYTGKGIPNVSNPAWAAVWNLESASFASSASSGGGRGGYTYSTSDQNELVVGPNNNLWSGDKRRNDGGLGGHPLTADPTRIFMGGGGGCGDQNNSQAGPGGAGGGIVLLNVYGTISGTGSIVSNGANGFNSNPTGAAAGFGQKKGNDAAGGAGGGGAIVISHAGTFPAGLAISAKGGNGGNHNFALGSFASGVEGDGPGGAGAGGQISITSGTPTTNVTGGTGGVSNSAHLPNFPPNGATNGAAGIANTGIAFYDILVQNDTICGTGSTTLTATVTGTLPAGSLVSWYTTPFANATPVATGLTYNPGVLGTTTTYYVGTCPGTFRKPVKIVVGPNPIISGTAIINDVSCLGNDGAITGLTVSSGTPAFVHTWNNLSTNTITPSADLSGVGTGNYTLTVTDVNGCSASSGPYAIGNAGGPVIDASNVVLTNQNCLGTNGSITGITATGTGTLTYAWNPSAQTTANLSNVAAGSYTLTVTDGNSCAAVAGPFTLNAIPGPSIDASNVALTPEYCAQNNGSISGIAVTGTIVNYTWNGIASAGPNAINMAQNTYTLIVTDNLGCTATSGPHIITEIAGPSIQTTNLLITSETCNLNNGKIQGIQVSGGTLPYSQSWTNTSQTTLNLTNLDATSYTLTVTDGAGCAATSGPHVVPNAPGPVLDATSVVITPVTCVANGSVTGISVTGGTGALTYFWAPSGQMTPNLLNAPAGSYNLVVVDANNCLVNSGPYVIQPLAPLSINASNIVVTPSNCNASTGTISGIQVNGGINPVISWSNSSPSLNQNNLAAGNYTLTVTDDQGCTATSGPHNVPSATGPSINATNIGLTPEYCGQNNGSISGITVTGSFLTYMWNSVTASGPNVNNLDHGVYTLVVTDNLGCSATSGPYTIAEISGPVIQTTNLIIVPETCEFNNGQIQGFQVVGGTLPYTQSWTNTSQTALNLNSLNTGSYTLTITDAAGCVATSGPHVVPNTPIATINQTNAVVNHVSCTTNGSVTGITVTGPGTSTYAWTPSGQTALDLLNVPVGTYQLVVTDGNGCIVNSAPYLIHGPTALEIDLTNLITTPTNCTSATGSISGIQVMGGINPVTSWSNNTPGLNQSNLAAGSYTLSVTDDQGCTDAATIQITVQVSPTIQTAGLVVEDAHCGQATGAISGIAVTGGTPTYQYLWNETLPLNTLDLNGLLPGTYELLVTDAGGCTATTTVQVNDEGAPIININNLVTTLAMCNESTGSVFGISAQGNGILSYSWNNTTQTNLDLTNLAAGTYVLTVTDAFGCSAQSTPVTILNSGVPDAGIEFAPVQPKPEEWVVFSDASTGTAPVMWEWDIQGVEFNVQNTGSSFPAEGIYPVMLVVTDINGCTDTARVYVQVAADIVIPNIVTANNDGTNDAWVIKGLKSNCQVNIVNRWGNLVFETDDYKNNWTGQDLSGTALSAGVYTYYLQTQDGKVFQGFIHLVL